MCKKKISKKVNWNRNKLENKSRNALFYFKQSSNLN